MTKFFNKNTGSVMYVDDSRVDEYKGAGHIPALNTSAKVEVPEEEPEKPKRATRRKK